MEIRLGVELIAEERKRKKVEEGWTPEHDDTHAGCEMARAAQCYVEVAYDGQRSIRRERCPWSRKWWKPSKDPIRNLVKAGALIAAEIDRLQREKSREG